LSHERARELRKRERAAVFPAVGRVGEKHREILISFKLLANTEKERKEVGFLVFLPEEKRAAERKRNRGRFERK
jgi:hypothetical protein